MSPKTPRQTAGNRSNSRVQEKEPARPAENKVLKYRQPTRLNATFPQRSASGRIEFQVPIKATFTLNSREHWAARARKRKLERIAVAVAMRTAAAQRWFDPEGGVLVTLTRVGPRKLDSDNVQGALKSVRDEIALQLGMDDGDDQISWIYEQAKGEYGVRAVVEFLEVA